MTFSSSPRFHDLKDRNIVEKIDYLYGHCDWGANTDIEAAYRLILTTATSFSVPQEHMPTHLVIISDMQWDPTWDDSLDTHHNQMEQQFADAGYKMPSIVYWNVRDSYGLPASDSADNVAIISGYNPQILETVFSEDDFNPVSIMDKSIENVVVDLSVKPFEFV